MVRSMVRGKRGACAARRKERAAMVKPLDPTFRREELRLLRPLSSPERIQAFLDEVPYSADPIYRAPRSVMRDRKAHCFDGALFAACALRRIGHTPRLVDLRAVRDDDHVLAIFERHGHFGAIAKSNFVGLRFREPVFRNLRELALSYFEVYYNTLAEKTLRAYSMPLDLRPFDRLGWMTEDAGLAAIAKKLDAIRHFPLVSKAMIAGLARVDERSFKAGLVGVNEAGLYRPDGKPR
jgi:hypothetical protein